MGAALVAMTAAGVVAPVLFGGTWLGLLLYAAIAAALVLPTAPALAATAALTGATVLIGVLIDSAPRALLSIALLVAVAGAGTAAVAWVLTINRALRAARSELVRLAAAQERVHLSHELHDAVKQQAFVAAMELGAAREIQSDDPGRAAEHLGRAAAALRTVQVELSGLVAQLRGTPPAPGSLGDRLRDQLAAWSQRHRIKAELRETGTCEAPPEIQQELFAAASEALTNVARHSHATRVDVIVEHRSDALVVRVCDDGRGADPVPERGGSGLAIIAERMHALGGTSSLTSGPRTGTELTLRCPLPPHSR